jgi:hypothetical protein
MNSEVRVSRSFGWLHAGAQGLRRPGDRSPATSPPGDSNPENGLFQIRN